MTNYYPTYHHGCNPIHEVKSWSYVRSIIRAARRGEEIPPIMIEGSIGGGAMLNGTHRSAANDIMQMLEEEKDITPHYIDVIEYDEEEASEELVEAVNNSDYERIDELLD